MQEGGGGDSMHLLLSILADGEEQAGRLLGELPPATHDQLPLPVEECCRGMARQLRCTFAKAIAVAKAIEAAHGGASGTDSPRSADESSGVGGVAMQVQERQGICKRRKGLPRWTKKFRIPEANLEYTPDDGLSWRKYGQKDILGAKFPRGYYRCTYRNAQSCPATKQVQRSDDDLAVFDVTYQGEHTCHQKQRHAAPPPPAAHDGSHRSATSHEQDTDMQLLTSFKNGLRVETGALPPPSSPFHGHDVSTGGAFSFPYAATPGFSPVECGGHEQLPAGGGCFSPASFISPATTASAGPGYYAVESSELAEVVSAATSSAAPAALDPAAGFDYSVYECQYHDDLDSFVPMFGHPSSHGRHGDA